MSRHGSATSRGAPAAMLLFGTIALVAALALSRGASNAPETRASTAPGAGAPGASIGFGVGPGLTPSGSAVTGGKGLPQGLQDRGWVAEVAVQRWIAGTLGGRILVLPADETGLSATAASVVSVRYGKGGASSTVRVRDFGGGRLRLSVDRPGTVSSALIVGDTLYIASDDGSGSTDAGVQAVSLADGAVTDVIAAGPAPAELAQPVTRGQLRLSPSGHTLASPLCSGDICSVDLIDLASGQRRTIGAGQAGFLLAVADDSLYVSDEPATGIRAVDVASGAVKWSLADAQIGGVLPSSDGARALIGYVPNRPDGAGPPIFTLSSVDAASGSRRVLLQRAADTEPITFFPGLSSDRFAVIASGGSLSDVLGGIRHRIALTLVDAGNGSALPDAVTLTAP